MDARIRKFENYKHMKASLKRAMKEEFYYQAIFIEYAIIEDRTASVLRHAGVKSIDNRGWELKLSAKLNKLRSHSRFADPFVRKRLSLELLDEIEKWKRDRDQLIHSLAKLPYDHEAICGIAVKGLELVNTLDNKARSVNRHFEKEGI